MSPLKLVTDDDDVYSWEEADTWFEPGASSDDARLIELFDGLALIEFDGIVVTLGDLWDEHKKDFTLIPSRDVL